MAVVKFQLLVMESQLNLLHLLPLEEMVALAQQVAGGMTEMGVVKVSLRHVKR